MHFPSMHLTDCAETRLHKGLLSRTSIMSGLSEVPADSHSASRWLFSPAGSPFSPLLTTGMSERSILMTMPPILPASFSCGKQRIEKTSWKTFAMKMQKRDSLTLQIQGNFGHINAHPPERRSVFLKTVWNQPSHSPEAADENL